MTYEDLFEYIKWNYAIYKFENVKIKLCYLQYSTLKQKIHSYKHVKEYFKTRTLWISPKCILILTIFKVTFRITIKNMYPFFK